MLKSNRIKCSYWTLKRFNYSHISDMKTVLTSETTKENAVGQEWHFIYLIMGHSIWKETYLKKLKKSLKAKRNTETDMRLMP